VIDLTLQAVTRNPQDPTLKQNLANFASYVSGLAAHGRSTQPTIQPTELPSTSPAAFTPPAWPTPPELVTARYAPLEQYESFSVAVPSVPSVFSAPSMSSAPTIPIAPSTSTMFSHAVDSTYAQPTYAQPTTQVTGATQLLPNQWNIASAAQSPRPTSGWVPIPAPAASNNGPLYPPPYGTQSQWK